MLDGAEADFQFDLHGRIRNLSLPPSAINALIPLFEAVSNSLHAIEARFGVDASSRGLITVELQRQEMSDGSEGGVTGFVIRDNGIGLNDENMKSFRTSDSAYKIKRGGKGVGRLSWLKTFDKCSIQSRFELNNAIKQRSFLFSIDSPPISSHKLEDSKDEIGTEVRLIGFALGYAAHCPKRAETIVSKIVGHFLPYFVVGNAPTMTIVDGSEKIDVRKFFSDSQERADNVDVCFVKSPDEVQISLKFHHILLKKSLKFLDSGMHWLFYGANDRVALNSSIDNQIGLKHVGPNNDCVYVGLVSGQILDSHINQERTGFSLSDDDFSLLHKSVVASAKEFLSEYINKVREIQRERVAKVISANPQFLPFRDGLDDFVREKLSLNVHSEEDIFIELSRHKLRNKRKIDVEMKKITSGAKTEIDESVHKMTQALSADVKSSLAEYVVRRKQVLELLDSSLSYDDPAKRKYLKEEAVHELICPMRSSSDELAYDDHNLWILDDRLAFYTFFQSDKPFSTFVDGSDSGREPDIALMFDRSLAFQREGRDEPIVIIEFKRPGRDDYNGNTSPVVQVLEYVDEFRSGNSIKNYAGRVVKPISTSTRFICYVVADLTDSLRKVVRSSVANHATADGAGYFGYSEPHNAYVEIVPYDKVLTDAKIRNEAFFSRLKLI